MQTFGLAYKMLHMTKYAAIWWYPRNVYNFLLFIFWVLKMYILSKLYHCFCTFCLGHMKYILQHNKQKLQTKTVETKNVEEDIPAKLKNNQVQLHQFHVEEGPQEKTSAEPFFAGNAIPSSDSDEHPTVVFRVESESMNSATASRASVSRSQQPETGETRQENVDECGKQRKFIKHIKHAVG